MHRRLILTIVLAMSVAAGNALGELIAYYPFNEGEGTFTADATGNGNDGTFNGDVEWVAGYKGRAVRFDTGGERIVIGPLDPSAVTNAMTLAAWINWEASDSIDQQGIIGKRVGWDPGTGVKWFWQTNPAGDLLFRADSADGGDSMGWGNGLLVDYANEWVHVALTWDNGAVIQYINGEEVSTGNVNFIDTADDTPMTIGCVQSDWNETFVGTIDEVQIHDVALTPAGLQQVMTGDVASSSSPVPPDNATDVRRDVVLSWLPGEYAASHDVYFGTSFADVEAAERSNPLGVLASQGQVATTYDLDDLLDFGQTYYWRVDEVNAAPDETIYKGQVWSFTAEPFVYPLTDITATASIPTSEGAYGPEQTVNGSGLNAAGQHSTADAGLWLGDASAGGPVWIQYDFDKVYKLYDMHVWNYNGLYELFLGFGFRNVTIEYAVEPNEWMSLGDFELVRGTSLGTFVGQSIDLGGLAARSVRITAHDNWGTQAKYGLSEVQFRYVSVYAREPRPAAATANVDPAVVLSWRPGREAASHQVYFGADELAVIDRTVPAETVVGSSYSPGSLDLGTSYYWSVDEVNEATVPSTWPGEVWDFVTQEYLAIDNFESYTDDDNLIYNTWIDGYDVTTNGSLVGHETPPYAERSIVNSGRQSMPVYYDNTGGVANSEAERTFSPAQNWTASGADTLSLYYRGNPTGFHLISNDNIIMNGTGNDIWGTTDQFRFVYKQLTGNGSIIARIDSLDYTNEWAKAGVMIRESLDSDSKLVDGVISASLRACLQWRSDRGVDMADPDAASNTVVDSFALPHWIRLTRAGDVFTVQHSTDGQTWLDIVPDTAGDPTSITVAMASTVYIGLAVCSHATGEVAGAQFSGIATTGNVTGQWQSASVGTEQPAGNGVDVLYVSVTDSAGRKKTVFHPSLTAVGAGVWTQWLIPLSDLTAAGVNTGSITKLAVGVGDPTQPSQNAAGLLYIDDMAFGHPIAAE